MPKLIWIDLETTGLDPVANRILEVCAFESTVEDPFNAHELYHAVLAFPGRAGAGAFPDPWCLKTHANSGLWAACADATKSLADVQAELVAAIGPVPTDDYKEMPVLAGSTPQFDRGFVKHQLPQVDKLFHHRHFDVSSVKLFARMLGMPKIVPQETHRAREDVLESIDHARRCFAWCRALNVQPPVAA